MILEQVTKKVSVFKKAGCLLLAGLLAVSAVSCSRGETEETTEEQTTAAVTEAETEDPRYTCDLPEVALRKIVIYS